MIRTEYNDSRYPFPFVAYTNPNFKTPLPLVIQLHGAGERGGGKEDLHLVDVHGFSKLLIKNDFPCTVIMPQCPKNSFWVAHIESLIAFINRVADDFGADKSNVSLTGLSMGGFGTWYTAMARPDMFSKIAPVCGGGMPWNAGVLDMPVWAFHGEKDTVVLPENSITMVNKLREYGKNVKFDLVPDVGHNVWQVAYTEDLLNWLVSSK